MIRPPERPEIPEQERPRERFVQILAIAIVIAALGVALVEFLHEFDGRHADAAGIEGQKLAIQEQGAVVRAEDSVQAQVDTFSLAEEERTRSANAFQQAISTNNAAQTMFLNDEQTRWSQLAQFSAGFTSITPDGATGPQKDVAFPNLALVKQQRDADILDAQQDAAKAERNEWESRLTLYSVVITFFAIAGVLFGLALTLGRGVRRGMAGLGAVLLLTGLVWTGVLQLSRPTTPPDAAADEYADGVVAVDTAYTQPGDQGLRNADDHFSKAIDMRPHFAQAYLQRSTVRFLLGSPQRNDPVVSITTTDALKAQGDDLQKAYDYGLRTKQLLNNLAANRLLLSIEDNQNLYDQARGYIDQAVKLDDSDPLLYYNRGLAYLGAGQTDSATAAYRDAIEHTIYSDVDKKTPVRNTQLENARVSGALTPLQLLADHRPDRASQAAQIKAMIVDGVNRPSGGPTTHIDAGDLTVQAFPGELVWSANLPGLDPAKDSVWSQWYFQDQQKLGWASIPAASGAITPSADTATGPDAYFTRVNFLRGAGRCLDPGRYRVELYVDGRLAGRAEADTNFGGLDAATQRDLGTALCRPAGWTDLASSTNPNVAGLSQSGFDAGFLSADNSQGVYLFRFQNPGQKSSSAQILAASFRVATVSVIGSLLPAPAQLDQANVVNNFLVLDGLDGGAADKYVYSGGVAVVGSAVASDRSVIVAVVFGDTDFINGPGTDIFNSIVTLAQGG